MFSKAYKLVCFFVFLCSLYSLCINIFVVLIVAVMAFYNEEGYSHIGTDKYTFLKTNSLYVGYILISLLCALVIVGGLRLWQDKKQPFPERIPVGNNVGIPVGNNAGISVGINAGISVRINAGIPALILPVSGVVFLLGYFNRFGIFPLEMESASPGFISTIGNINWHCGYLFTVFFGFLYLFWEGAIQKTWQRAVLFGYAGISFATLVT